MPLATLAICTFNRADRLPGLAEAMLAQQSPIPFELLFVNNNSTDDTLEVLKDLAQRHANVRFVTEAEQGIVPARNRAIAEALDNDYMLFMDDDELPGDGLLQAGLDGFADDFLARGLAVALADHAHRHAAGAEALDAHGLAQFAQLVVDLAVDFLARQLDRQLALQPSGVFYRDLHNDD